MKIAYLDCFSGISGDMFLGALVDAGVPVSLFEKTVAALDLGAALEISRVDRSGITATKVDVLVHGEKELPREEYWEAVITEGREGHRGKLEIGHRPEHTRQDSRGLGQSRAGAPAPHGAATHQTAPHQHSHEHSHSPEHEHGRGLVEIREIIARAKISDGAKKIASAIFQALGEAEAKIHNVEIEKIHFHEVGAVDAMVDIVCAAVGAEALGVDEIVCSPLNVGGGTVKCAHGTFPIPAPATVELLKDAPVYSSGVQAELVTPTGAAIVKVLAKRFAAFPAMKIEKAGYGAGTRDFAGFPNVLRITIGEEQAGMVGRAVQAPEVADGSVETPTSRKCGEKRGTPHLSEETISVLEANLDDLNPQVFGYVMERLLAEDALDAFGVPVQMKKGRPGMLLTVLCKPEDAAKLTQIIFAETTTLGVRHREEQRQALARKWVTVTTQWGDVRMKIASMNGTVTNYAPEYEDCRRIAAEKKVPLKSVMQEALRVWMARR